MNKAVTCLLNLFHYIAGGTALGLGYLFLLISAGLATLVSIQFGAGVFQIGKFTRLTSMITQY